MSAQEKIAWVVANQLVEGFSRSEIAFCARAIRQNERELSDDLWRELLKAAGL